MIVKAHKQIFSPPHLYTPFNPTPLSSRQAPVLLATKIGRQQNTQSSQYFCSIMKGSGPSFRKTIRVPSNLHNSSALIKTEISESRKTFSLKKPHARSIKTLQSILPLDVSERYSGGAMNNTRCNFKSSRKLIPRGLKRYDFKKASETVTSVNVSQLHVTTKSWCLFDQHNKKYYGFREEYRREIASLTKIMTAIVAIELASKLGLAISMLVKVTQNASNCAGTTAGLVAERWISIQDLLYGAMLPSGNDAAFTLAEYLGYFAQLSKKQTKSVAGIQRMDLSKESTTSYLLEFIQHMNHLAKRIGIAQSTFSNPHGLMNALNLSSAKDMLTLSIYACRNKLFKKIASTREHFCTIYNDDGHKAVKRWENTNKLLERGWEGVKTGLTPSAGSCLSSVKDGLYIVVLNCSTQQTRFSDTEKLYDWYRNFRQQRQQQSCSKIRLHSQQASLS